MPMTIESKTRIELQMEWRDLQKRLNGLLKKFAFLLAAILCLPACCTDDPAEIAKANPQILRFAIPSHPASLDPAAASDLTYYQVAFNLFETLIEVNWQTGQFDSSLATAWQLDSTGLCWTFTLRRGVKFHDGTPLNAEAVKISFERQFDAHSRHYRSEITDKYGPLAFDMLKEIRALNDSTLQFILKYPYAAFLDNLATPCYASIVSPRGLETFGENFGQHPVGTGSFEFVRWLPNSQIMIKKFSQYWGKAARLDSAIYQIIPLVESKIEALEQGQVDIISGLSAAYVDPLYGNNNVKMVEELSLATVILGMKCDQYPFNKIQVRQAVAHAIDKEYIVQNLGRNLSILAKGPLSPLLAYYDSTLASPPYDTVKAEALLKNLGYANGAPISLNYCIDTDSLRGLPVLQAIKTDLGKAGLTIAIRPFHDWPNFETNILHGNSGLLFYWAHLSFTRHPHDFLYSLFHSESPQNYFNYKNSEVDELLTRARRTIDSAQQRLLYRRVQEIILQEAPAVFINHPKIVYATRTWVKNFHATPLGIPVLQEVEVEERPPRKYAFAW
jgi:peptide/nickel transport system substrate-binding protein